MSVYFHFTDAGTVGPPALFYRVPGKGASSRAAGVKGVDVRVQRVRVPLHRAGDLVVGDLPRPELVEAEDAVLGVQRQEDGEAFVRERLLQGMAQILGSGQCPGPDLRQLFGRKWTGEEVDVVQNGLIARPVLHRPGRGQEVIAGVQQDELRPAGVPPGAE